ncbi:MULTISPECIES: AbrB/MazE/SpoVT family DNA-binding domain-containing protein [Bacillus cereus group]|jgi:transcriptional pleiotropic regulator of transition state genes|uniref:AbrB/MazE/SpoVT family DNA-binding domain-containing protein n=3 Tax=Bacillus thuringiensis TaxID=1428 RepID=A0AAP4V3G2_BACTU|nr:MULTISPECIES: AbrB/MazE/SpoVT family DNA-binding domain-containing protein [Bacillus cereus group]AGG05576.1 Transition state regulatory protein AbrB [Bacillus thuringiensis serovar thuringiensis str. IS5056]ANC11070.1 AbrB family transcriptional regulator [Bacillus cereus]ANC17166.1 AbrB family transcriptional regulator [Bacillus cereus]ARP61227.1 AbrB/MazE/SpoVT family DNA-binding domain-containing protein [Bacillus thuringiensis]AST05209.1 AbrB/MazE/SpoVT family DNA-binding domain-contai
MKSTGVTRRVDELGRIVIPKELRRTLGIVEKDPIEIFVEDEKIILQKYKSYDACAITGDISEKNISLANGQIVLSPEGAKLLIKEIQQQLVK